MNLLRAPALFAAILLVAANLQPSKANSAPYNDIGDFAQFSFSGTFDLNGAPPLSSGDTLSIDNGAFISGGTEEFRALDGQVPQMDPTGDGALELFVGTGASNNGQTFTLGFDRSGITDPAQGNPFGTEAGTLAFTITDTVAANAYLAGGLSYVVLQGLLSITASAFYDTPVVGSFSLLASSAHDFATGNYTMAISTPGIVSAVPTPEANALLLTAVGVFGFFGWRRKRLAKA